MANASVARPRRPNRDRFVRNPNAVVDILVTDESHFELRNAFGFSYVRPHFACSLSTKRKTLENNQKSRTTIVTIDGGGGGRCVQIFLLMRVKKKKKSHTIVCAGCYFPMDSDRVDGDY